MPQRYTRAGRAQGVRYSGRKGEYLHGSWAAAVTLRQLVIAGVLAVLLVVGLLYSDHTRHTAFLPEWVPDFGARPLPAVGERRIAAHWKYALALRNDHRLYAWGGSGAEGFPGSKRGPLELAVALDVGLADWRYVSAGISASYAVTAGGALLRRRTWLDPEELDDPPRYAPLFPGIHWVKADEHLHVAMGLSADGKLYVWSEVALRRGRICDRSRECFAVAADGTLATGPLAVAAPGSMPWTDFWLSSAGREAGAYALDVEGKAWRVTFDAQRFEHALPETSAIRLVPLVSPVPFQRVYPGPLLLDRDRRLWTLDKDLRPQRLSSRRWLAVDGPQPFTVAIDTHGHLWAWGANYHRHVLKAESPTPDEPALVDDAREWVEVDVAGTTWPDSSGAGYVVARDRAGEVYTWGASHPSGDPFVRGLLADGGASEHRAAPGPIVVAPP